VVGIAIGASYATQQMGLSFAVGAFLAGILVSTTEFRFHALSEIAPFRYCFNGLFFVALGMIVNPSFVVAHISEVALLVVFILIVKMAIVGGTILAFGYPLNVSAIGGLMLAQVGEFSFMLVFLGHEAGAIGSDFYHLIVDAAAITMIIAPFVVMLAPKIGEKLAPFSWKQWAEKRYDRDPLCDEHSCLINHAIICGFGPLGMTVGHLLEKKGIPYVVLELNPFTANKVKDRDKKIFIGDGASADLLLHSGIERARMLAIAVPDYLNALAILKQARQMNTKIFIVIRSRYRDQVDRFYEAGADVVVCEELEAGIEMGRYVLESLGYVGDEVDDVIRELRAFGSADFF
jgi:CPA2 family monovalent cation:H+ antiporter-2